MKKELAFASRVCYTGGEGKGRETESQPKQWRKTMKKIAVVIVDFDNNEKTIVVEARNNWEAGLVARKACDPYNGEKVFYVKGEVKD